MLIFSPKSKLLPLFLLLFFCLAQLAQAQSRRKQDVIFLKNGGIMRGEILEMTDDFKVKLETEGRNVFVFERTEIERISREDISLSWKEKGYVNMTELGVLTGQSVGPNQFSSVNYHTAPTSQTFNGYQFWPMLQVGLTTGIDWYQNFALVPVAAGLRGDLSRTRITPFYFMDLGYGFRWLNNNTENSWVKGGLMWNPGLGLKVRGNKNTAWIISVGYKSQRAESFMNFGWQQTEQKVHYSRLSLRTGISF
jgi:sRNA-binding regulator protein Hfq